MHYLIFTTAAIVLWATLAVLVSRLAHVPPFFLLSVTLLVGGALSIAQYAKWQFEWRTLAFGVTGIFGYHFLLIMALRLANPVEANLINYLWPLLIVVLSPVILRGFSVTVLHMLGASMGFSGVYLLMGKPEALDPSGTTLWGYLMALSAAVVWACYSLISKRLAAVRTATVGLYCLISGALALIIHLMIEDRVSVATGDWWHLMALGLGPMGAAFYAWDAGLKRGDPRVIGTLSYLTPLLSTLLLLWVGNRSMETHVLAAMVLIVGGAFVSTANKLRKQPV